MTIRRIDVESAKSAVRVAVARALAQALITGIDNAEQEGRSLTELQQSDLATMSIMAFHEALDTCESLEFEAKELQFAAQSERNSEASS